jgi:protein TonB
MLVSTIGLLGLIAASCASNPRAKSVPETIRAPQLVQRVEPEYPADLRRQRVTGSVVIAGTVPKEGGRLRDAHVVSSADPRLSQYALNAVIQWIWAPGLQDGQAVDVQFETTVSFSVK